MKYTWVIADLHGEKDLLDKTIENMRKNGFDLADPEQTLVQLGDRNDRGPDSYGINEWFKTQQIMFPGQVIVLLGNHDRMMLDAAEGKSDLMYYNGGTATARSYAHGAGIQITGNPTRIFPTAVRKSGHYDWLKNLPLYHETPEYFFSHAPIPKEEFRTIQVGLDFRQDEHTLTWSYVDERTHRWVDPNLIPIEEDGNFQGKYKTCVYGHIHGIQYRKFGVEIPGPRVYGNAILMDNGCGCHPEGYASALRLPDRLVVTSNDEAYNLDEYVKEKLRKQARELMGLDEGE